MSFLGSFAPKEKKMSKIILNGMEGEVVEVYKDLPNIGLGPSKVLEETKFIPASQEEGREDLKFVYEEKIRLNNQWKKIYNVFRNEVDTWVFVKKMSVPMRTKMKDLHNLFEEGEEGEEW